VANFNRYLTAGDIINGAAVEVGLTPVTDPFSSGNAAFVQLRALLTTAGRELVGAYQWQQLRREYNLPVAFGGAAAYPIPEDYDRIIDQSQWDRQDAERLMGPATPQMWQALQGNVTNVIDPIWRLNNDQIEIYPAPPAGAGTYLNIYFEYISMGWVRDDTDPNTYRDYPESIGDFVLYNSVMITKMLKMRFLAAKGFDTTAATNEFATAYAMAVSKVTPSEVLSVVPCAPRNEPFRTLINNGVNP
jgi:hypothetical protein